MKKIELEQLLQQKNKVISDLTDSIRERDSVIAKLHKDIADYSYFNNIYKQILKENSEEIKKIPTYEIALVKSNELLLELYNRVNMDNMKYEELKSFLMKLFPTLMRDADVPDSINSKTKTDMELSNTFISDSGDITTLTTAHIIDVAMTVINYMKEKFDRMSGLDNDRGDNDM